ncbi:MAG: NAD(P)-dependent oxidoreductase [Pirellulales bacterium]
MPSPCVLVTGGSGFIGAWVLRELHTRGMSSVAFDRAPAVERWQRILGASAAADVKFAAGDLSDREALGRVFDHHAVTHVIHLAALLTPACQLDPYAAAAVNILGSVALWEAIRARRTTVNSLAYASSLAVYGPEADDGPAPPAAGAAVANQPPTFYGATKRAVELLAHQYWVHYQIGSIGIRPHVVYGPERNQGISAGPSLAARAAALGESYTIGFEGCLGYDYVEDVARAFVDSALASPVGASLVDLPSEPATPQQFIQLLDELVPGSGSRLAVAGPTIPSNVAPTPAPINELFPDWRVTSLREGLARTVAFYHGGAQ